MISAKDYQSIPTPEDLEEERTYESILAGLLQEYDPEEGDYKAYKSWCMKRARELAREALSDG